MEIRKTLDGEKATFEIEGWLDTETAPELGVELEELDSSIKELVFDLSGLEYVSSAGVRQIVSAWKKMDGNLTLCNVSAEVLEVFRMTGVSKRVTIA